MLKLGVVKAGDTTSDKAEAFDKAEGKRPAVE